MVGALIPRRLHVKRILKPFVVMIAAIYFLADAIFATIAHPLARCWMNLEAANLMVLKAASLYDRNADCAAEANAAKYLAAEAAFEACETAVLTHGGMGYSREFHVERYLREVMIPRIAPITPHMILNFIAEKVLGLPKSY